MYVENVDALADKTFSKLHNFSRKDDKEPQKVCTYFLSCIS